MKVDGKTSLSSLMSRDPAVRASRVARSVDLFPYYRRVESGAEPRVMVEGRRLLNLASNNYLGLAVHPEVIDASQEAVGRWGTGVAGSRLFNGTILLHQQLEDALASFFAANAALVYSSGYVANLGLFSALASLPEMSFVLDESVHASVLDGILLGGGKFRRFRHNDLDSLARVLDDCTGPTICAVDGVYSMSGDTAVLPEITSLCRDHGAGLCVDEAHAVGVVGATGAGAAEASGTAPSIDIRSLTFSKALGSCGGAVLGDDGLIEFLRVRSRPMIFTASSNAASLAAAHRALELLSEHPEWVLDVAAKAAHFRSRLLHYGVETAVSDSAITTIELGEVTWTAQVWKTLWDDGIYCSAVVPPAVSAGRCLLRCSVMRLHDVDELDDAARAIARAVGAVDSSAKGVLDDALR